MEARAMKPQNILFWTMILLFFSLGLFLGFILGLEYTVTKATEFAMGALSGSTIHIDLNETELVNKMNETLVPEFKKAILNSEGVS